MPDTAMRADARWRPQEQLSLPPLVRDWLADPGSLTARLRLYGAFRVVPREDRIIRPTLAEQQRMRDPRWNFFQVMGHQHQSGRIRLLRERSQHADQLLTPCEVKSGAGLVE